MVLVAPAAIDVGARGHRALGGTQGARLPRRAEHHGIAAHAAGRDACLELVRSGAPTQRPLAHRRRAVGTGDRVLPRNRPASPGHHEVDRHAGDPVPARVLDQHRWSNRYRSAHRDGLTIARHQLDGRRRADAQCDRARDGGGKAIGGKDERTEPGGTADEQVGKGDLARVVAGGGGATLEAAAAARDLDRDGNAGLRERVAVGIAELEHRLRVEGDATGGDGAGLRDDDELGRECGGDEDERITGETGDGHARGIRAGLAAERAHGGGASRAVGRGRRRIDRAAVVGGPGDFGAGDGFPESVGDSHDERVGQRLADRAVLPVAAHDVHLGRLALVGEDKVVPTARRDSDDPEQDKPAHGASDQVTGQ